MNTNTVEIITEFGDKLDQYLGVLAEKAGVASDHFWPLFVKQQTIEAISSLLMFGIFAIVAFVLIKIGTNAFARFSVNNNDGDETLGGVTCASGIILTLFITIHLLFTGPKVIGKLLNPEYYAVQSLVQMVR